MREPNTQYILSLSYGKDSLACLEAIRLLGLPLDRIVHAELWATDTIPADLPPMVEFKQKADRIIKERYGITVEHICATRERERERNDSHTKSNSTPCGLTKNDKITVCTDSLYEKDNGVLPNSKQKSSSSSLIKVTYEMLFYEIPTRVTKNSRFQDGIVGFPIRAMPWCNSRLKTRPLNKVLFLNAPSTRGIKQILCSISA